MVGGLRFVVWLCVSPTIMREVWYVAQRVGGVSNRRFHVCASRTWTFHRNAFITCSSGYAFRSQGSDTGVSAKPKDAEKFLQITTERWSPCFTVVTDKTYHKHIHNDIEEESSKWSRSSSFYEHLPWKKIFRSLYPRYMRNSSFTTLFWTLHALCLESGPRWSKNHLTTTEPPGRLLIWIEYSGKRESHTATFKQCS